MSPKANWLYVKKNTGTSIDLYGNVMAGIIMESFKNIERLIAGSLKCSFKYETDVKCSYFW